MLAAKFTAKISVQLVIKKNHIAETNHCTKK